MGRGVGAGSLTEGQFPWMKLLDRTDVKKPRQRMGASGVYVFWLRVWCLGPESNRHAAKRQILSLLCLPVPPPRHARKDRIIDEGNEDNEFFVCVGS